MVVTLPFALLLVDAWPLGRFGGLDAGGPLRLAKARAAPAGEGPLVALGGSLGGRHRRRPAGGSAVVGLDDVPLGAGSGNALVSYVAYLEKTFWPSGLAAFYPHPSVGGDGHPLDGGGAVGGGAGRDHRSAASTWAAAAPYLPWGWLWFLGTLLPVIGIVQVGLQSQRRPLHLHPVHRDPRGCHLAGRLARRGGPVRAVPSRQSPPRSSQSLLLGVAARAQVSTWRTSEALWRRALAVTSGNWQAWAGLGDALFEGGRVEESAEAHRRSLQIRPRNPVAWNGLGVSVGQLGRLAEADRALPGGGPAGPWVRGCLVQPGHRARPPGRARAGRGVPCASGRHPARGPALWANLAVARARPSGTGRGCRDAMTRLERIDPSLAARMRRGDPHGGCNRQRRAG